MKLNWRPRLPGTARQRQCRCCVSSAPLTFRGDVFEVPDPVRVAMMSEECPVPLGSISLAGPGQSEDYGLAHADDIIEEVGPGDDISIGSDLSTLVLPFPELAPVVFFCLKQTTCPRNWCIRMLASSHRVKTQRLHTLHISFHIARLPIVARWLSGVECAMSGLASSRLHPDCIQ
ncbi:Voltage-dependent T-type calcium channel subunit alpha-1I [Liparis tanakae]|uniref:Voltage-dependent T-type calcium channel subunit alpha-1I n=1 Tax=Liparis tanakae TaxID=230148 RepID=A0A4Z2GVX3_9TELE|nr:Voltage-dependent T-type calcium channel subunit alpha-1I [Liparis tanakae]